MGCPSEVEIGDNLVFSITTHDPDTGVLTDADSAPAYRVYEDEDTGTGTAGAGLLFSGTMSKLDDANTTGFYTESIACTSGNGFENGRTYTIYIEATVDSDKGGICFGFKAYDQRKSNVKQVSDDSTAADNLELQYDATGLTGDTFPATQSQLGQIANVSGLVKRAPSTYVLTTGTQSANTVSATEELDGTRHEHTDTAGAMDLYYEFDIGPGLATEIKVTGYLQGNNDDLEVYGYDWVSTSWKQIGTMSGQASAVNVVNAYDLLVDMVGSGANEGLVRVRFTDGAFTLTTATLAVDQILVEFAQGVEGYQNGAVWLDTNASNTNTVRGVDGTATNPVSTIAAVNTLLASTGLARVEVAPQSSFTLAATQANQQFVGRNWTLALGGQSASGSYIEGADVTGVGTGASEIHFSHCHFGAVTLPPCDCEDCLLEGTFTIGAAGNFFFESCKSGVAGTSTPVLDFGGALNSSNVNFRAWSGGIEIQNMGAGTGSYDMSLEGWGQLVINANCSATSTVAIRGNFTVTDNASGAVTLNDDARYDVTRGGYTGGAVFLDTNASNTNTVSFEDGVEHNPVSTLAAAITIAGNVNSQKLVLTPGSSITLTQAHDNWIFDACHSTIALGGQSVNNAVFYGAVITGNDDGSNANHVQYFDCVIGTNTLGQFVMTRCYFTTTLTLAQAGSYFLHQCFSGVAGTSTPTLDFGSGLNASNVNIRDYSGGIEIENMGAGSGSYNMSLEGNGQLVINANCSATSTVAIRGNFTVTDNASGAVTLSDEARFDVAQITGGSYALNTTANGNIGVDWANVENPSSAVNLANTTVNLVNTITTYTGNTVQTGDSFARLGAPAGASVSVDIAALKAETVLIVEDTGTTIPALLPAALVGGRMSSDAVAISGSTEAADNLEASAETIVSGAAAAGTLSTTEMTTNLTEATDDHYNGRLLTWTSGVLQDQQTDITDYDGSSKKLTYTAVTEAPSAGDTFVIQ